MLLPICAGERVPGVHQHVAAHAQAQLYPLLRAGHHHASQEVRRQESAQRHGQV